MTDPRTLLTLFHRCPDGREVQVTYVRDGELQAREQLTSWVRDCAVKFLNEMEKGKE